MKKLLLVTFAIAILGFSCKKDEEKTFSKSQLIGTWTQVLPASEEGEIDQLVVTNDTIKFVSVPKNGFKSSTQAKYTFDGKIIKFNLIADFTMTISELTATKFAGTQTSAFGSEQFEYKK